jgi:hypothetical protein
MEAVMARIDSSGFAIAGVALAQSLLETLRANGVLSDLEADEVVETALAAVESKLPADDPGVKLARAFLEAIGDAGAQARRPKQR